MAEQKLIKDPFALLGELSKIGKKEKEIEVTGCKIKLGTINAEDEAEVFSVSKEHGTMEFFARTRIETIARAIIEVNGENLKKYENIEGRDERLRAKAEVIAKLKEVVGSWNEELVMYVYTEYSKMLVESEQEMKDKGIARSTE